MEADRQMKRKTSRGSFGASPQGGLEVRRGQAMAETIGMRNVSILNSNVSILSTMLNISHKIATGRGWAVEAQRPWRAPS